MRTLRFAHSWITGPHPHVAGATRTYHERELCKLCVAWSRFGVRADGDVRVDGRLVVPVVAPERLDA